MLLHRCIEYGTLLLVKKITWDSTAKKEIRKYSKQVKTDFGYLIFRLQKGDLLTLPESRAMSILGRSCFELRVKDKDSIYRTFYCLRIKDEIIIFHTFKKKSQKTPKKEIEIGEQRLREILNEKKKV